MEALGRFELPTCGLGNRRSIHLSYRAKTSSFFPTVLGVLRLRSGFRQRARTPANRLNLGNRRSIHLSYRAKTSSFFPTVLGVLRLRSGFRQRARTPAKRLNLGNRRSIHLSYRATYTHYICGQETRPSLIWILQIPVFVSLPQQSTRSEQVHEL